MPAHHRHRGGGADCHHHHCGGGLHRHENAQDEECGRREGQGGEEQQGYEQEACYEGGEGLISMFCLLESFDVPSTVRKAQRRNGN